MCFEIKNTLKNNRIRNIFKQKYRPHTAIHGFWLFFFFFKSRNSKMFVKILEIVWNKVTIRCSSNKKS